MHKAITGSGFLGALGFKGLILVILLGGLAGLGQAPFGLWPLTVLSLALFLRAGGKGFKPFWLYGLGYFLVTLFWIVEPFLVDLKSTGWMAPFAILLMAGGMALFWGLAGLAAARGGAFVGAMSLALAEALRSYVFTGFPWVTLGAIWIDTPLAQMAALFGPLAMTMLTLLVAYGLGHALWVLPTLALSVGLWIGLPQESPELALEAPVVRLVQPNIAQRDKWTPETVALMPDLVREMSLGGAVDLIVWPETATPWLLDEAQGFLAELSREADAPIALGGLRFGEGLNMFNSLAVVDATGAIGLYDKAHLVPFGEYIPFGELLGRFGVRGLAASDGASFAAGEGNQRLSVPGIGLIQPLICYEGIFAHEVNASGPRARLITLVTNDAWFGTISGPYQHLVQARWRAIEQGVPVVRVANTGVSAMIDARGKIVGEIGLNTQGILDVPLPSVLPPTPYSSWGDWPSFIANLMFLLTVALRRKRKGN